MDYELYLLVVGGSPILSIIIEEEHSAADRADLRRGFHV